MNTDKIMELLADIDIALDAICVEDKTEKYQVHTDAICHHVNCIARAIDDLGSLRLAEIVIKRLNSDK